MLISWLRVGKQMNHILFPHEGGFLNREKTVERFKGHVARMQAIIPPEKLLIYDVWMACFSADLCVSLSICLFLFIVSLHIRPRNI
jgi:hypothetical protein